MSVYVYVRVSTVRQADEGLSLDVQRRICVGYGQMHGWKVDRFFVEEGVSGSVPLIDRPMGEALWNVLKRGDIVVASKLDRMFRSASDALDALGQMKQIGVSLHLIDLGGDVVNNGVSKLVFTILAAVAEQERDRTRERIVEVKADQKSKGAYLGGKVPYGFGLAWNEDMGRRALVANAEQQGMIERMKQMHRLGASLRTIKAQLALELSVAAIHRICREQEAA